MRITLLFAVMLVVSACSNSSTINNPDSVDPVRDEPIPTPDEEVTSVGFEGFWVLAGYTLDDGTMKSVPASIQVSLLISSNDTIEVQYDACDSYQISYQLDNDVLTTSNPVDPEGGSCAAIYDDDDNSERSELMRLAFLNTQTLIAISMNSFTVTTVQNEILIFDRSDM